MSCRAVSFSSFVPRPRGKHVVHDWDDQRALTILRNVHAASRPGSHLILLECVLSPSSQPHLDKWLDIEMLLLPGGRARTEQDYSELLEKAGFRLTRVVPTKSPVCVLQSTRQG